MNKYVDAFLNFKSYSSSTINVYVKRYDGKITSELIYKKDGLVFSLASFSEAFHHVFYTPRYYLGIYVLFNYETRHIPIKTLNHILKIMKNVIKGVEDFFGRSLGLEPVIDENKNMLILKDCCGIEYIPLWHVCYRGGFEPYVTIIGYPSVPYRKDLAEAVKEFRELYLEYIRLIDDAHRLGLSIEDIYDIISQFYRYEAIHKISSSYIKVYEDRILFNCRDKPITIEEIKTGVEILREIIPELKKTLVKHEILSF
jgi:hypothetical protein